MSRHPGTVIKSTYSVSEDLGLNSAFALFKFSGRTKSHNPLCLSFPLRVVVSIKQDSACNVHTQCQPHQLSQCLLVILEELSGGSSEISYQCFVNEPASQVLFSISCFEMVIRGPGQPRLETKRKKNKTLIIDKHLRSSYQESQSSLQVQSTDENISEVRVLLLFSP